MIATYQRISRADGDLGKDGKDKSNSIENQKELIQRYISHKESLQNLPVMILWMMVTQAAISTDRAFRR